MIFELKPKSLGITKEQELEPHFHPSSYGYRPGKSAHQALDACAKNGYLGYLRCVTGWSNQPATGQSLPA